MRTAERWPSEASWRDRADRAIAANLIQTNAVLRNQLETLIIVRRSISLVATRIHEQDTSGWQRLGTLVAGYLRADGRVQQLGKQFGRRLDRLITRVGADSFQACMTTRSDRERIVGTVQRAHTNYRCHTRRLDLRFEPALRKTVMAPDTRPLETDKETPLVPGRPKPRR